MTYNQMIPTQLRDHTMKANPQWYRICVPLRLCIGLAVILATPPPMLLLAFAIFIVAGFLYKLYINPRSWKNYYRTIAIYTIIAILCAFNRPVYTPYCGLLIIVDALMGQHSHYIASTYIK